MKRINSSVVAFSYMVDALLLGATTKELCEHTGLHRNTMQLYLQMMKKLGCIHIESWQKDWRGAEQCPVYILGRGKDAKANKLTRAQVCARYRAKKKQLTIFAALAGKNPDAVKSGSRAKNVSQKRAVQGVGATRS